MKYLGYYDTQIDRYLMSPAAVSKMNYIASSIAKQGLKVEIISCGMITSKRLKKSTEYIDEKIKIRYFKSIKKRHSFIGKIWNLFYENCCLFLFLLKHIKKDEEIMVYHSLRNMYVIYLAKKIKGFKIILEVEEFYNDVKGMRYNSSDFERKYIKSADKYIFPTEIMDDLFNAEKKKSVIIHGTYQLEKNLSEVVKDDKKIHVVYAGTFDKTKGGVMAAIDAAAFLSDRYQMHILGFGREEDILSVKEKIEACSLQNACSITYEGMLIGQAYNEFLKKCHIGISTQNPSETFNNTSFPSKILSYMANGLRVVTIRIPVVESSKVGDDVTYYNIQEPAEIAEAIKSINIQDSFNVEEVIKRLDKEFCDEIMELIER